MIKIRIAETLDFNKEVINFLRSFADVTIEPCTQKDIPAILSEYDVFWFRLGFHIGKEQLKNSVRCKILATPVTGIDHIDEKLCREKGIRIACLRGERDFLINVRATAELTLALTLDLLRRTGPATKDALDGNWRRDLFRGSEIFGKRVGIIGYGRLGAITASYFESFGAQIFYTDTRKVLSNDNHKRLESIEELILACDIISIHVNLNDENINLLSKKRISLFDNSKYLINTSRGGLVDEEALLEQLKYGKMAGAAIDVVKDELNWSFSNPLGKYARNNSNLIITPHIGGNTYESFEKTEWFIAKKIKEHILHA
ncbi:MAG: NAD(P)-dependent oxidoreductase [Bacteroidia bacterium]